MPLNPNIAMGYQQPQLADPLNQFAKFATIQNAQQENQLAQMKMAEMQRGLQEQEGMRNFLSQNPDAFTNPNKQLELVARHPTLGPKVLKEYSAGQLEQANTAKARADAFEKYSKGVGGALLIAKDAPTDQALADAATYAKAQGLPANQVDGMVAQFTAIPDLAQRKAALQTYIASHPDNQKALDRALPVWKEVNLDGKVIVVDGNPVSPGYMKTQQQWEKTMTQYQQGELAVAQTNARTAQGNLTENQKRTALEERRVTTAENNLSEPLSPKEVQKREAKFPQAQLAVKTFESKSDEMVKDLEALKKHPGLSSITGVAFGRTPSLTSEGRAAQVLYDKIIARGGFSELKDMRDTSPTGGALGNVSDTEGRYLRQAYGALGREQSTPDMRKNIDEVIKAHLGAKDRVREAFDTTYEYKAGKAPTPTSASTPSIVDFGSLK